jgi:hypothetical protein
MRMRASLVREHMNRDSKSSVRAGETRGSVSSQVDGEVYVAYLADFMLNEPYIHHCITQVQNDCLTSDVVFRENGRALKPEAHKHVQFYFKRFARECVQHLYACGFIPWYIDRKAGARYPRTPPLGSFTWKSEFRSDGEQGEGKWPIKYSLRGKHVDMDKMHIRIFYLDCPQYKPMQSPLDSLLKDYLLLCETKEKMAMGIVSSIETNVLVSEKVDVKDQSLEGLQLLNDTRTYAVTGQHPHVHNYGMYPRRPGNANTVFTNVNDAQSYWLANLQENSDNLRMGMMPPNTEVTELSRPHPEHNYLGVMQSHYIDNVLSYFNVVHRQQHGSVMSNHVPNTSMKNQYNNILYVCGVLQQVLCVAYAETFQTENAIECTLNPQKKLEVASVTDMKVLFECGIYTPAELRKML